MRKIPNKFGRSVLLGSVAIAACQMPILSTPVHA